MAEDAPVAPKRPAGPAAGPAAELLVPDKSDFTNWYKTVLEYTRFLDDRYPLKGCYVWQPFGYRSLKLYMRVVDEELEASGHEEVAFPLLCPEGLFAREQDFLKGMQTQSLRVTKYGTEPLGEELIVRPTSETIMYPMYALWVRSAADLPLRLYQTVPVYRWETKMTSPMLRVREVSKFNEAHTAHATREEMERQIDAAVAAYRRIFDRLLLPYEIFLTPSWDTFPGAAYNLDIMTVLPNGKAVELASVIAFGQRFAKVYGISFQTPEGEREYAWQTCYGLSERALGAAVAIHGDDRGLRLPSAVAPFQVVIVPIHSSADAPLVAAQVEAIRAALAGRFRVHVDGRDLKPGRKYFHWEAHGVPVRLEVGAREARAGQVTLATRHDRAKSTVRVGTIADAVAEAIGRYDRALAAEARQAFEKTVQVTDSVASADPILAGPGGIVGVPWSGTESDGQAFAEKLAGNAIGLRVPLDVHRFDPEEFSKGGPRPLYFARTV